MLQCNINGAARQNKACGAIGSTFLSLMANSRGFALCKIGNSPKFSG
jgi:hypothetical protein